MYHVAAEGASANQPSLIKCSSSIGGVIKSGPFETQLRTTNRKGYIDQLIILPSVYHRHMWQCQRKGPTLSILENEIHAFEVKKVKFIENEILLKMASIVSQLS